MSEYPMDYRPMKKHILPVTFDSLRADYLGTRQIDVLPTILDYCGLPMP